MNALLVTMLGSVVEKAVSEICTEDNIQKYGDKLFDLIENVVADSATKIDDVTVLPVVRMLRSVLDVPDREDTN